MDKLRQVSCGASDSCLVGDDCNVMTVIIDDDAELYEVIIKILTITFTALLWCMMTIGDCCVTASYLMTTESCTFLKHSKLSKPRILLYCLQPRILLDITVVARSVSLMYLCLWC